MIRTNEKSKAFLINTIFSSFVLSLFGWAILQSYSLRHGAPITVHILLTVMGTALTYVSICRYRAYWPAGAAQNRAAVEQPAHFIRSLGSFVLLLSVASVLALFTIAGGPFLIIILASGLHFIPWSKISVSRDRFFISAAVLTGCAAFGVVVFGSSADRFAIPIAAVGCWLIACTTLMIVLTGLGDPPEHKSRTSTPTAARHPDLETHS